MAELRLGQHPDLRQKFGRNDQLLFEGRLNDEVLVLVLFTMRQEKAPPRRLPMALAPSGSLLEPKLGHFVESPVSPLWCLDQRGPVSALL